MNANHCKSRFVPLYEQKFYSDESRRGQLTLQISPDGRDDSVQVNSDSLMYSSLLQKGQTVDLDLIPGRLAYIHDARGDVAANGTPLSDGDGATISEETVVSMTGTSEHEAEILLFQLQG